MGGFGLGRCVVVGDEVAAIVIVGGAGVGVESDAEDCGAVDDEDAVVEEDVGEELVSVLASIVAAETDVVPVEAGFEMTVVVSGGEFDDMEELVGGNDKGGVLLVVVLGVLSVVGSLGCVFGAVGGRSGVLDDGTEQVEESGGEELRSDVCSLRSGDSVLEFCI